MKLSEQDIIKIVSKNTNFREEVIVPIGNDACVFYPKQESYLVATTDTMALNTHFSEDITPYELGYISAASNISDLSAMGSNPAFAMINLTLKKPTKLYINELIKGYNSVFKKHSVMVIGGDTTYGSMSISMTLIGYKKSNNFMLISDAKKNDKIFISGAIGNSLMARKKNKYYLPEIRNELGVILSDFANSCTDMSDGFFKSINQISLKSNLGAKINLENIKINNSLKKQIDNKKIGWSDVLGYGDDYELLFTVSNKKSILLKKLCNSINLEIYEVGIMTNNDKINYYLKNALKKINSINNFEHFNRE